MLADDYRRRVPMVQDRELEGYVSRVAAQLRPNTEVTIALTGQGREAVGYPGGHVFVALWLLAGAADEPSFARSVAHAIAHCAAAPLVLNNAGGVPLLFQTHGEDTLVPAALRESRDRAEADIEHLAADWTQAAGFAGGGPEFQALRARARDLLGVRERRAPSLRQGPGSRHGP